MGHRTSEWGEGYPTDCLRGGSPNGAIEFAYMDTATIGGVVFELIQRAPRIAPRFEDTPQSGMNLAQLKHVGIVVKDLGRTVDFYDTLGLVPFSVQERAIEDAKVAGRTDSMSIPIKLASSQNCLLPIELVQPLSSEGIYHESLERQGEGIQHVGCWVSDLADELERLEG